MIFLHERGDLLSAKFYGCNVALDLVTWLTNALEVYDMSSMTEQNGTSNEFIVNTGTEPPIWKGEKTDLLVLQGNTAARSAKVGGSEPAIWKGEKTDLLVLQGNTAARSAKVGGVELPSPSK